MNIIGDDAKYIRGIIFNFASVNSDDLRGIVINSTLYFIVNHGMLYEIHIPIVQPGVVCCFFLNFDNNYSFKEEDVILDCPDLFNNITESIAIIKYCNNSVVYSDDNCLESSEQFNELSNLRAGDGSIKYFIDTNMNHRSFVTICKSMFKLNKNDKLSLVVYDANFSRLLYKFSLFKKKYNTTINIYLLTIDLYTNKGG